MVVPTRVGPSAAATTTDTNPTIKQTQKKKTKTIYFIFPAADSVSPTYVIYTNSAQRHPAELGESCFFSDVINVLNVIRYPGDTTTLL